MNNEVYYFKKNCQEIKKGDKQSKISKKELGIKSYIKDKR